VAEATAPRRRRTTRGRPAATTSRTGRRPKQSAEDVIASLTGMVEQLIIENRQLKRDLARAERAAQAPSLGQPTKTVTGLQRRVSRALTTAPDSRGGRAGSKTTARRPRRPVTNPEVLQRRREALAKARQALAAKRRPALRSAFQVETFRYVLGTNVDAQPQEPQRWMRPLGPGRPRPAGPVPRLRGARPSHRPLTICGADGCLARSEILPRRTSDRVARLACSETTGGLKGGSGRTKSAPPTATHSFGTPSCGVPGRLSSYCPILKTEGTITTTLKADDLAP
jgi:hypothetical protein